MILVAGSTFIFGSWICTVKNSDQLQGHLMEILTCQASPVASIATLDLLAEKFSRLSIFDPTQTQKAMENEDSHLDVSNLSSLEIPS
jgi:hypothetical protein